MKPTVTLRNALNDPQLVGNAMQGDSLLPMRTVLIAGMGAALISDEERAIFTKLIPNPGSRDSGQGVPESASV